MYVKPSLPVENLAQLKTYFQIAVIKGQVKKKNISKLCDYC